jgi:hypothetical protein
MPRGLGPVLRARRRSACDLHRLIACQADSRQILLTRIRSLPVQAVRGFLALEPRVGLPPSDRPGDRWMLDGLAAACDIAR